MGQRESVLMGRKMFLEVNLGIILVRLSGEDN